MRSSPFMAVPVAALLVLAVLAFGWTLQPDSSEAQSDSMHNCPLAEKWSIAVWEGPGGTAAADALATCGTDAVAAAYSLDPQTGNWSRWFAAKPDVSNLPPLNDMQGVLVLGSATGPIAAPTATATPLPATPIPSPTPTAQQIIMQFNTCAQYWNAGLPVESSIQHLGDDDTYTMKQFEILQQYLEANCVGIGARLASVPGVGMECWEMLESASVLSSIIEHADYEPYFASFALRETDAFINGVPC